MRKPSFLLLILILFSSPTMAKDDKSQDADVLSITLGQSIVALNGPWKFHTGDNPQWADPNFDDAAWETVDLTPLPGSHDDDVGLTGYVGGWMSKGHPGYTGYAWYRMRVSVKSQPGTVLALAGPPSVDYAYQVFIDGRLLGSDGDFSGSTPVVYSIQPRMFIPQLSQSGYSLLAFRVWLGPPGIGFAPDSGGIHIAPALGDVSSVEARYRLQWLQTFCGYVVDAIEPVLFMMLAVMAASLIPFDRTNPAYLWLIIALTISSLVRLQQVLFFWTQSESIQTFDLTKGVVLIPLALGAWTVAWNAWLGSIRSAWFIKSIGALTFLYIGLQMFSRPWLFPHIPHSVAAGLLTISNCLRLVFALSIGFIIFRGIKQRKSEVYFALPAIVMLSIGLFAQELSWLGVRGIWFPYGTGVSRTQYAYAIFDLLMFGLLLRRLIHFAPPRLASLVTHKAIA